MIISLCGEFTDKMSIIDKLKDIYKEKLLVYDFHRCIFKTQIQTEKQKYELDNKYNDIAKSKKIYQKLVEEITYDKTNKFLKNNKDSIIVLISNNILYKDINATPFFAKSDLKILVTSKEKNNSLFNQKYNKKDFDYVINSIEKTNIRKLVKL